MDIQLLFFIRYKVEYICYFESKIEISYAQAVDLKQYQNWNEHEYEQ